MKKLLLFIAASFMLICTAAAAEDVYLVCDLETRPITVNLQNETEGRLPNLKYNGIAYIPLDEYNCALMGLQITDSPKSLSIDKTEEGEYSSVPVQAAAADMSDMVTVVDKFVIINGRFHDNAAMSYPFVTFNNTYYMPVYWQYIHRDLEWNMKANSDSIDIWADNCFFISDLEADNCPNPTGDYYIVSGENCVKLQVRKDRNRRSQQLFLYDGKDFNQFASNIFDGYDFNTMTVENETLKIGARHKNSFDDEKYKLAIDLSKGEISEIYYEGKIPKDIATFAVDDDGNFANEIKGEYGYYDGGHVILNGTMMRSYSVMVTEKTPNGEFTFESPYWIACEDLENYGYDITPDFDRRKTVITRNTYRKVTPLGFDGTDDKLPVYDSDWKIVLDGQESRLSFNIGGKTLIYCGELGEAVEEEYSDGYFVMKVNTRDTKKKEVIKNRVVAYYSVDVFDEPVSDLQTRYLTDIIYAFVIPRSDGSLFVPRPETLKEVVAKAKKDHCRVFVSLGGGGNAEGENVLKNFEDIASDSELTRKFKENCVWMIREYGLDGLEVDWESPTNATKDKYESFMNEFCNDERIESVSIAVSGTDVYPNSNVQAVPDSVIEGVDFINIMAYGIYGQDHSPYSYAVSSLDYWLTRTDRKEKLILGVPLFSLPGYEQYRHLALQGKDILHSDYIEDLGIYINSRDTLIKKAWLAKEKGGGIMFFDIHEDTIDDTSAAKAVFDVLQR